MTKAEMEKRLKAARRLIEKFCIYHAALVISERLDGAGCEKHFSQTAMLARKWLERTP